MFISIQLKCDQGLYYFRLKIKQSTRLLQAKLKIWKWASILEAASSSFNVILKVGKLLRGVTVGHVERPGLVWINAPPTEDSNALLQKVLS